MLHPGVRLQVEIIYYRSMCVCACVHEHVWVSARSSAYAHLLTHATVHLHISDNGLQGSAIAFPLWVLRTELKSSGLVDSKAPYLLASLAGL